MKKLRTLTLIALAVCFAGTAGAETLKMEGMASSDKSRPARGMSKTSVESKFGSPDARKAPVGDPPISRWEYRDFVVFFEYDRVIHAVVRR